MGRRLRLPSFVAGRGGLVSIVDALVWALWEAEPGMESGRVGLCLGELTEAATRRRGTDVPRASVRCEIYRYERLFERSAPEGGRASGASVRHVRYRLTSEAQALVEQAVSAEPRTRPS